LLNRTRRRIRVWGSGSAALLSRILLHTFLLLDAREKRDTTGGQGEKDRRSCAYLLVPGNTRLDPQLLGASLCGTFGRCTAEPMSLLFPLALTTPPRLMEDEIIANDRLH